jgi:hypothetical protein
MSVYLCTSIYTRLQGKQRLLFNSKAYRLPCLLLLLNAFLSTVYIYHVYALLWARCLPLLPVSCLVYVRLYTHVCFSVCSIFSCLPVCLSVYSCISACMLVWEALKVYYSVGLAPLVVGEGGRFQNPGHHPREPRTPSPPPSPKRGGGALALLNNFVIDIHLSR